QVPHLAHAVTFPEAPLRARVAVVRPLVDECAHVVIPEGGQSRLFGVLQLREIVTKFCRKSRKSRGVRLTLTRGSRHRFAGISANRWQSCRQRKNEPTPFLSPFLSISFLISFPISLLTPFL